MARETAGSTSDEGKLPSHILTSLHLKQQMFLLPTLLARRPQPPRSSVKISFIPQDLHKLQDRVAESEICLSHMEEQLWSLQWAFSQMHQQQQTDRQKQDDNKNRMCYSNPQFIGLP